jgi:hypothetical protein
MEGGLVQGTQPISKAGGPAPSSTEPKLLSQNAIY